MIEVSFKDGSYVVSGDFGRRFFTDYLPAKQYIESRTPSNQNCPFVWGGLNAGGGYTVYDKRPGFRPVIDFYTELQAFKFIKDSEWGKENAT